MRSLTPSPGHANGRHPKAPAVLSLLPNLDYEHPIEFPQFKHL